jgi:hypothetical protein
VTSPGAAKGPFDPAFRTRLGIAIAVLSACAFMAAGLGAAAGRFEPRLVIGVAIAALTGLAVAYLLGDQVR